MWDAERYAQFAGNYTRPFLDLLAQIKRDHLATIVDLGCGPGDLTRLTAERWPEATVIGLDSSVEMLQAARAGPNPPGLTFLRADIATWHSDRPVDLLISNAALQWVPDHAKLLPRLTVLLAPGGTLAVQMPDHFAMPVARAITEAASGSAPIIPRAGRSPWFRPGGCSSWRRGTRGRRPSSRSSEP